MVLTTVEQALQRYEPVIGLEVHAQLKTRSKLFTWAPTDFTPEHPNRNIDIYCIGLPGVLPVLNREVVDMAIRTGLALDCQIRPRSIWARKHYFYPDLPKGYQISQYEEPICEHGRLEVRSDDGEVRRISIGRIHMEEDAGKNTHVEGAPLTLVDYNRAGIPLLEIVSGPDLRSPGEASRYLKALRSILRTLDVCDGNMEEGSFRCDANVSIRPLGAEAFGTRCEIKNLNSFRFVEQAIEIEILRHARILAGGGSVDQETRLYDSAKRQTRSMRGKEEAHDYRYLPDPDLPPLVLSADWIEAAKASLPELPAAKRARYEGWGVPGEHARTFSEEPSVAAFFDSAVSAYPEGAVPVANFVKGEVLRELKDTPEGIASTRFDPADLATLVRHKEQDKISSSQCKKIFGAMWHDGTPLQQLLAKEGEQVSDTDVLVPVIDQILAKHEKEVAQYRAGKTKVLSFFIGKAMKVTKGRGKPQVIKELIIQRLGQE